MRQSGQKKEESLFILSESEGVHRSSIDTSFKAPTLKRQAVCDIKIESNEIKR